MEKSTWKVVLLNVRTGQQSIFDIEGASEFVQAGVLARRELDLEGENNNEWEIIEVKWRLL